MRTLGEAFDRASAGDEIWIAGGHYDEATLAAVAELRLIGGFAGSESSPSLREAWSHRVFVSSTIELLGSAQLEDLTLVAREPREGVGLRLACEEGRPGGRLELSGVVVRGFDEGLLLELVGSDSTQGCSVEALIERSVFQDNRRGVSGRSSGGGYVEMARSVEIERSVFDGNREQGVGFDASSSVNIESRLEVRDSLVTGSESGFMVRNRAGRAYLSTINVLGYGNGSALDASSQSPFRDEKGAPLRLDGRDFSWDMHVAGNTLVDNEYGFLFYQDDLIDDHEIWRNYVARNDLDGVLHGNASGNARGLVEDNWLIDNGRAGFHHAPHVCGVRHVRRNLITGNRWGFWSRDNGCERFVLGGEPEWRNDLSGNREYALAYDGLALLDAEWNYWGHNDHDAIQAMILAGSGGPVDVVPWFWPLGGEPAEGAPPFLEASMRVEAPATLRQGEDPELGFWLALMLDTLNSGVRLGEVGARLTWDPRLARLEEWAPGCEVDHAAGVLVCVAAESEGREGLLELARVRFEMAIPFEWAPHFDLEIDRLSGEGGEDLLPLLMAHDDLLLPRDLDGDRLKPVP
jgi:hypothetical protein